MRIYKYTPQSTLNVNRLNRKITPQLPADLLIWLTQQSTGNINTPFLSNIIITLNLKRNILMKHLKGPNSLWSPQILDADKSCVVRVKRSEPNGWTRLYSPGCGSWLRSRLDNRREAGTPVSCLTEILLVHLKRPKNSHKKAKSWKLISVSTYVIVMWRKALFKTWMLHKIYLQQLSFQVVFFEPN